jgi:hypothetical protein
MNKLPAQQKGASAIGTIIILAVLGYGAYLGIQYVPQMIESKGIDSILKNIVTTQKTDRITTEQAATEKVIKLLQVNEMNDMTDKFKVTKRDGKITITFNYDRELNLGYKLQPMPYEKSVTLN